MKNKLRPFAGGNGDASSSSDGPQRRDDPIPPIPSTLLLEGYMIHWQHLPDGGVVIHFTLTSEDEVGNTYLLPPRVSVRMTPATWELFQRDVARGGWSSGVHVPFAEPRP